jgi:hypothetical protein
VHASPLSRSPVFEPPYTARRPRSAVAPSALSTMSSFHQQPSPTVLRPRRPRQQLRLSTVLLIDQFSNHLDPATGPAPLFPTGRPPPLWSYRCGEPLPFPSPKSSSPTPRLALGTATHPLTTNDGRNSASEPPARKGGIPCLSLWPKGPRGLGRHGRAGQWPIGLSPFHQCPFTFFLRI